MQGQIFVLSALRSDSNTGVIGEYTFSGGVVDPVLIQNPNYSSSCGLVYDGNGHLFSEFVISGPIWEYTTSGGLVKSAYVSGLPNPAAFAVDTNGYLFAGGSSTDGDCVNVGKYTTSGAVVNPSLISATYPGQHILTALALDGCGYIFVGSSDDNGNAMIRKYTTAGAVVSSFLIAGLTNLTALAVDANGWLFVATTEDFGSATIGKYTTSGAVVRTSLISGLKASSPAMALDGKGHLFVLLSQGWPVSYGNTVAEYTTSGGLVNASLISGLFLPTGIVVVPEVSVGIITTATNVVSSLSIALTGYQGTNTAKVVRIDNKSLLAMLNGVLSNSVTKTLTTNNFIDQKGSVVGGAKLIAVSRADSNNTDSAVAMVRQVFYRTNVVDTDVSPWLQIAESVSVGAAATGYEILQLSLDNGSGTSFCVNGFATLSRGNLAGTTGKAKGVKLSNQLKTSTASVSGAGYLRLTSGASDAYSVLKGSVVATGATVEVR